MAVLIQWENPPQMFTPVARRVRIWRGVPNSGGLVLDDACWGFEEDPTQLDTSARYTVEYLDGRGYAVGILQSEELRVYTTPPTICRVDFALARPDGSADSGVVIDVSNLLSGGDYNLRVATNSKGVGKLFLMPRQRVQIRLGDAPTMLDCIVPSVRSVSFDTLAQYGSIVPADTRSRGP